MDEFFAGFPSASDLFLNTYSLTAATALINIPATVLVFFIVYWLKNLCNGSLPDCEWHDPYLIADDTDTGNEYGPAPIGVGDMEPQVEERSAEFYYIQPIGPTPCEEEETVDFNDLESDDDADVDLGSDIFSQELRPGGELCCPICLGPVKNACVTDCGHTYCGACILRCWNKDKKRYGMVVCPVDRMPIKVIVKCHALRNLVGKYKKRKATSSHDDESFKRYQDFQDKMDQEIRAYNEQFAKHLDKKYRRTHVARRVAAIYRNVSSLILLVLVCLYSHSMGFLHSFIGASTLVCVAVMIGTLAFGILCSSVVGVVRSTNRRRSMRRVHA